MLKINNPVPIFTDKDGDMMSGGRVYIGAPNADPLITPLTVFFDQEMTIVASQPLRILGGRIVNDSLAPTAAYVAEEDYSIRVTDANGAEIDFVARVVAQSVAYQPEDADLTAIAEQGTTSYGRGLLGLTDQTALRAATGIPDPLPKAGGVAGDITHIGAGAFHFWVDVGQGQGRCWLLPSGGADPTSQPGDTWFGYS